MKIEPCGHRVIVKPDALSDVEQQELERFEGLKNSGFQIADSETDQKRKQSAVTTGVVLSIGSTAWADFGGEPWCSVGDRVYFAKYGGMEINQGGEMLRLLNDEDIIGRVVE